MPRVLKCVCVCVCVCVCLLSNVHVVTLTFMTSCAAMPPITACIGQRSPVACEANDFIRLSSSSSCFAADFSFVSLAMATNASKSAWQEKQEVAFTSTSVCKRASQIGVLSTL